MTDKEINTRPRFIIVGESATYHAGYSYHPNFEEYKRDAETLFNSLIGRDLGEVAADGKFTNKATSAILKAMRGE